MRTKEPYPTLLIVLDRDEFTFRLFLYTLASGFMVWVDETVSKRYFYLAQRNDIDILTNTRNSMATKIFSKVRDIENGIVNIKSETPKDFDEIVKAING